MSVDGRNASNALGSHPRPDRVSAVETQADALVAGLNAELGLRFTVESLGLHDVAVLGQIM